MKVRKMIAADAKDMAKLHIATWRATYNNIMPAEFLANLSVEKMSRNLEKIIVSEDIMAYVVEDTGGQCLNSGYSIVGDIIVGKARDDELGYSHEIFALNILPTHQKQGLGKLLLNKALENLAFCDKIYLKVVAENYTARNFYEKQGFVDTEKIIKSNFSSFILKECVYEYNFL